MSMTATVSRLDSFRYWRGNEDSTTEDWLNDLSAPPNHRMNVGAAFQTVLESMFVGGEFAKCEADGISFNFKCDAGIPQPNPEYGRKDYGSVLVSGRAGIVDGKRVEVFKTTKRFEAEKRHDDYQWRLLLDLFDADEFVWNIFVIAPNNPDETSYDVVDYHRLTATRYPGLHDDCVSLVNDYHGIMSSIPEEDMIMASIGKGRAKALPREVEMLTVHGDIVQETEDAILVDCGANKPVWLAKSQIEYTGARDDADVEIRLPDWMAEEKGVHDGQRKVQGVSALEGAADAATTPPDTSVDSQVDSQAPAPTEPAHACHFKGDVTEINADSITLLVTTKRGKEQSFTYLKKNLRFEGDELADLQVGYKGIEFLIGWDIAVESGLAKHLKIKAPTPAPESDPAQEQPAAPPKPETTADAGEDEAPKTKHCKNKLRSETITDYVKLTDTELANYGREMSEAMTRRTDHKETAANYSRLSRDAEKEAYKLNDIIQAGHEEREINCDVIGDFNTGEIVYVESEWPHREIRRQPMTDKDRQLLLPIDQPVKPQPEPEAAASSEPETAEVSAEPEEPETVTLYGEILEQRESETVFRVHYGDDANTIAEFTIPNDQIQMPAFGDPYSSEDMITLTRAYAVEAEIIAAPEAGASECPPETKACSFCSHLDADSEDNSCESCDDALSNFTPLNHSTQQNAGAAAGGVQ